MKKSLILISLIISSVFSQSNSLKEAFANGKTSGDVTIFNENRHINDGEKTTYYNNTSWIVGSLGLNYETDFYKNFKVVAGFRGAAPFYEDDKNFKTFHGTGDSTERIYENDRFLLSNLYLEYNAYDTNIKIGRQEMVTDWVGKINDGVRIVNNSISNLEIDALWTLKKGRAYFKEMWGFKKLNEDKGLFRLGATYKFDNGLSARIYGLYSQDLFSAIGGKLSYDANINDNFMLGGSIHYAQSDERKDKPDGKVFEGIAYAKYQDSKFSLGYVNTGKKSGWGSMGLGGDQIVPFEEGDVMYERDVNTYYAMLSTMIEKLSVSALYGTTQYKTASANQKLRQNEFSTWINYPLTSNLKAFVIYDQVFKAQSGYPALYQVGAGLSYSF